MGSGLSVDVSRTIYLQVNGSVEKISFSRHSSSRDVHELICQASKCSRYSEIALRNTENAFVTVSPTMPPNTVRSPYKVEIMLPLTASGGLPLDVDSDDASKVLKQVVSTISTWTAGVEQLKQDVDSRITHLEHRLDIEGLKTVEIEKCKKSLDWIRDQIQEAQKKYVASHNLSPATDEKKLLKRTVPLYPKYILTEETIAYLKQPTFDIWQWDPNEMLVLLEHIYHELGLVQLYHINGVTLKRWLLCVQENYKNNPFHNFRHCFCVAQMMYGVINLCQLKGIFSLEDLGVLVTAAICHDLDHPGYNNAYQINARTELAIRYNDISPLENHHCAVAFRILSNPETNIFANVDSDAFKRMRAGMTTLILATDMARHSEIMAKFEQCVADGFDYGKKEHVDTLKMMLIKCCDISNEVRPMEVSEPWLDCLLEEYFNQSDKEKAEGLPVAPFMDREKVTKSTAQLGFIKFVLIPMLEQLSKLFPALRQAMLEPLLKARDRYEAMKVEDELKREKSQTK